MKFCMDRFVSMKDYYNSEMNMLKEKIQNNVIHPSLAIVQVGDFEDSNSYVKYKLKDAKKLGIQTTMIKYTDIDKTTLINQINLLNKSVSGIIIQLPLPNNLDIEELQNYIDPSRDVDEFRSDSKYSACTPKGVIDWLKYNMIELNKVHVVVIGRGKCSGKPMAEMLMKENATVTCCHRYTSREQLKTLCNDADIVISCVGKDGIITEDMISDNTIYIDVGRGDFALESNKDRGIFVSPVIGGTGLLTRLALMQNVVESELNNGISYNNADDSWFQPV